MGTAKYLGKRGKTLQQSSAVLGVKPAFEDVDVGSFPAFLLAKLKTESSSAIYKGGSL